MKIISISHIRIKYLLNQYAANNCTKKELLELFEWIEKQKDDVSLQDALESLWQSRSAEDLVPVIDKEKVFAQIRTQTSNEQKETVRLFNWGRVVAAAVILLLVTAGSIYIINKWTNNAPIVAVQQTKGDALPGHSGAVLTLSNGQKIILDSAGNGALVKDGKVDIIKKQNGITYRGKADEVVYNTISTPNGRQWQLELVDGTKVWLNAASSIRYPLNFVGDERKVEVTGEAYFEVVHNDKQPFKVYVNTSSGKGSVIEDFGTAFNVNAYGDEPVVKTTLVEGVVKVSAAQQKGIFLKPGQQAVVSDQEKPVQIHNSIDVEEVTAWKDGLFKFNEDGVAAIMRQIGRWYNVDIVYEGAIPKKQIHGTAPRNTNLSTIIKVLSLSGVHVRLEGNSIIVKP